MLLNNPGLLTASIIQQRKIYQIICEVPIKISIEDVCAFTDIILQIITTIDAELIKNGNAETIFLDRVRTFMNGKIKKLDPYPKKPGSEIHSIVQQSGYEMPARYDELQLLLTNEKLVK